MICAWISLYRLSSERYVAERTMWNVVSMSNVQCENTRVLVQMKPSVKCNDADVNGGAGG